MRSPDHPVRVLIIEDSPIQQKMLRIALEKQEGIEIVGHASNGEVALKRLRGGGVDVVTLDLEMPVMGGLEVLEKLRSLDPFVGVIVVSAVSAEGARASLDAVQLGAFDLITKPDPGRDGAPAPLVLRRELVPRLLACGEFVANRRGGGVQRGVAPPAAARPAVVQPPPAAPDRSGRRRSPGDRPRLVVIGCSTGGPAALDKVIPALPADLRAPVLVVQHMPPMFTKTLAESLDRKAKLSVLEARPGQPIEAGSVLIAPGGRHLRLRERGGAWETEVTDDPPENSCRPSVDYLFRSAAEIVGESTLAVIMTGMGEDGTAGIRLLKARGAVVYAQDEASCVVFGMPRTPVEEGLADLVLPLEEIAWRISCACRGILAA